MLSKNLKNKKKKQGRILTSFFVKTSFRLLHYSHQEL
nr:MAG TPA: hypothetical protein [Caudoviricetes sp.]